MKKDALGRFLGDHAVVVARREVDNDKLFFEHVFDEWHKEWPIEPVLVQLVGHAVAGDDKSHPARKHLLKEALENHGIGHIGHLKLVKAQQFGIGRQLVCHGRDRILVFGLSLMLAPHVDLAVHVEHKVVEMHAFFLGPKRKMSRRGAPATK